MDLNVSGISVLSFGDFDNTFTGASSSTPTKPCTKSRRHVNKNSSFAKSPSKTVAINKPKSTCKDCGKSYSSLKHYKNHVRLHSIEKAASHFPSEEEILNNIACIDKEALENCSLSLVCGEYAEEYTGILLSVQNASKAGTSSWSACRGIVLKQLLACTINFQSFLPSHLATRLFQNAEVLLSHAPLRKDLEELLLDLHPHCDPKVIQSFIFDYIFKSAQSTLNFISASIRRSNVGTARKTVYIDNEDEEVIYYCSGSVLRGFLSMGRRYSSNTAWQKIVSCIKSKFLESDDTPKAKEIQKRWTNSINRGALIFINATALNFFVAVTKCCLSCEQEDGSLPYDEVIQTVLSDGTAAIWDDVVGESLSFRESLSLMQNIVKSFCQTCGNGIAKRLRNRYTGSKATTSVTLRHHVAPK